MTPEMLANLAHAREVLRKKSNGRGVQICADPEVVKRLDAKFGIHYKAKREFVSHALTVALNRSEGKEKAAEESGE